MGCKRSLWRVMSYLRSQKLMGYSRTSAPPVLLSKPRLATKRHVLPLRLLDCA